MKGEEFFDIHPDYIHCLEAANYILGHMKEAPDIGIILGSGLGPLASRVEVDTILPYSEIPNFPVSTVSTHKGELVIGKLWGENVVCMNGRFHFYEGYSFEDLAFAIRAMALMGVKMILVTNAAGAVNPEYKPGDIMIIKDHINLLGVNPVRGQFYSDFGDRFYDASNIYNAKYREIAKICAKSTSLTVHEGTYMFFPGPNYETPAEIRAAGILGADAVGMSTTPEALTAAHCGLPLLGISIITNMAAGITDKKLTDEEVNEIAKMVEVEFSDYVVLVLMSIRKKYDDYHPEDRPALRNLRKVRDQIDLPNFDKPRTQEKSDPG